jgi:ubiquinone/menaquinone biosynthesis C-methylase UbiE
VTDETKHSVRSQFGRQAAWYAASGVHRDSEGLAALLRLASPSRRDRALDVATGTGFTALALAPRCRRVIAVDLTPEMVAQARRLRRTRGVANVVFCLADAETLPFRDAVFDLVTCRVAAHHFPHLRQALGEMARVTRPGGRVVLDDTCTPEDPELGELMNAWERRRDPSHVANHPPSRLRALLEDCGLRVEDAHHARVLLEFDDWVRRAGVSPADAEELRRSFMEASPAARAAFQIRVDGHDVRFSWDEIVVRGVKR